MGDRPMKGEGKKEDTDREGVDRGRGIDMDC